MYYEITEATPFKEPWSTTHGTFQTFFCKFAGVPESVMVNKKEGNSPSLGQVYGSLQVVPGKKYLKFKQEQAPEGSTPPPVLKDMSNPENVSQGPTQLDRIEKKLDELLERKGRAIVDGHDDEPIKLADIPFN